MLFECMVETLIKLRMLWKPNLISSAEIIFASFNRRLRLIQILKVQICSINWKKNRIRTAAKVISPPGNFLNQRVFKAKIGIKFKVSSPLFLATYTITNLKRILIKQASCLISHHDPFQMM